MAGALLLPAGEHPVELLFEELEEGERLTGWFRSEIASIYGGITIGVLAVVTLVLTAIAVVGFDRRDLRG
jgi:hypothetical protein